MEQKPQVKVWQPQGFEGLEITWVQNSPEPYAKQMVMKTHFSVGLTGAATFQYGGEKQKLHHYSLNVFAADDVVASHPDTTWSYLALRTNETFEQGAVDLSKRHETGILHFKSPYVFDKRLNHFLCNLLVLSFKKFTRPTSQLERESHLLTALTEIIRHCADDPPPERRLGREHKAVGLIKGFLREHVEDDVALFDLAALTGLSKDHLIRVFARDVGLTPHVYQTNLRVHKAKKLLAAGTSIAETALGTGFSDQSHLHHTFKKYVLVTPGEYRRASAPQKVLTSG